MSAAPLGPTASAGALPAGGPLVFKFGGSSVADAERLARVASIIAAQPAPVVVVVSALGGVTDTLVELERAILEGDRAQVDAQLGALRWRHAEVLDSLVTGTVPDVPMAGGAVPGAPVPGGAADDAGGQESDARLHRHISAEIERTLSALAELADAPPAAAECADRVRATGEDLSSWLLTAALRAIGVEARRVDAREVVRTDARFTQARPDEATLTARAWAEIIPLVRSGATVVVQGFVGATADGRTTTLGRGGSDYSATLLAAALEAPQLHIWTDVEGVLSGDPRTVAAPRLVDPIGYEEAVELAHFGAKVLHPGAAKHAASRGLDVRVRSTFAPDRPGTRVLRERHGASGIAAIAHATGVVLIRVRSHPEAMPYGFLARVFDVLSRHQLPVDLVATSHTRTAFTIDAREDLEAVERELAAFADVSVVSGLATVTVVGRGLMSEPGSNARIFDAVGTTPVHLVSQASDVTLSLVVDAADAPDLVRRLHAQLVEEAPPTASSPGNP